MFCNDSSGSHGGPRAEASWPHKCQTRRAGIACAVSAIGAFEGGEQLLSEYLTRNLAGKGRLPQIHNPRQVAAVLAEQRSFSDSDIRGLTDVVQTSLQDRARGRAM